MSASPMARQACSHAQVIPSKKIMITDDSQLPDVYSSTPGGTLFSTTPGGKFFIQNFSSTTYFKKPHGELTTQFAKFQGSTQTYKKSLQLLIFLLFLFCVFVCFKIYNFFLSTQSTFFYFFKKLFMRNRIFRF